MNETRPWHWSGFHHRKTQTDKPNVDVQLSAFRRPATTSATTTAELAPEVGVRS